MGCFSWLCKECDKGIESDSVGGGEECRLYLIKGGKVVEEVRGVYDSYGGVYTDKDYYHASIFPALDKLNLVDREDETCGRFSCMDWHDIVDMCFDRSNTDGIAAVHERCFTGEVPTTQSADDPNQGWGDGEDEEYDDE